MNRSPLDRPLRLEMRRFLRDVRENFNIPALLVTHDFEEAAALSDKIIVYEHGKTVQIDSPEKIKNCPANSYVSQLIAGDDGDEYDEKTQRANLSDMERLRS